MIRVTLHGRLGNQMFQYAAARCLAKRHRTSTSLDTQYYWNLSNYRDFELWLFPETGAQRLGLSRAVTCKALKRLGMTLRTKPTFEQMELAINPAFDSIPDNSHIFGWFQSEFYFKDAEAEIRRAFDLAPFLHETMKHFLRDKRSDDVEVVSVHVRRGDYIGHPSFPSLDPADYYGSAMRRLSVDRDCYFVVFSDDPAWCQVQPEFRKHNVHFYSELNPSPGLAIAEMAAMSACDHNIISNSTFSWWAAWLNEAPKKTVIMPSVWLGECSTEDCGLLVKNWQVL